MATNMNTKFKIQNFKNKKIETKHSGTNKTHFKNGIKSKVDIKVVKIMQ